MFSVHRRAKPVLLVSGLSVALATYYSLCFRHTDALPLNPSRFTPTTLVKSVDVSANTKLLTLSVPPQLRPRDPSAFTPIYSIFIKDSDIQVERPYTPLEGFDENGHITLWVKRYDNGEVGRWLHSRKVGDTIEVRGPVQTWPVSWQNGSWDEIVLISGGTGITSFYQLLHGVFKMHDSIPNTRFTLLHGSRSLTNLPPSSITQFLVTLSERHPDRFQLRLFAESMNDISERHSLDVQHGRIRKSVIQDVLRLKQVSWWRRLFGLSPSISPTSEKKILVLVCGPEGMVNAIAGPYGRNYSQGEVGGILRELGLQSHQVRKL